MNEYINKLIQDDKLSISVDKSKTFGFKLGDKYVGKDKVLISGPCSVESRDMIVDWSQELKEVGVDFKTEKSIELSEEKNEKIRLAEEKRKEQKKIKHERK